MLDLYNNIYDRKILKENIYSLKVYNSDDDSLEDFQTFSERESK